MALGVSSIPTKLLHLIISQLSTSSLRVLSEKMELLLSTIIVLILLFIDGLVFGVAAAKGVLSIILVVIGLVLAGMIGIAIPFFTTGAIITHVTDIVTSQARYFSYYVYGFPIAWIIGFLVGLLAF
jgi:hypothetical protein